MHTLYPEDVSSGSSVLPVSARTWSEGCDLLRASPVRTSPGSTPCAALCCVWKGRTIPSVRTEQQVLCTGVTWRQHLAVTLPFGTARPAEEEAQGRLPRVCECLKGAAERREPGCARQGAAGTAWSTRGSTWAPGGTAGLVGSRSPGTGCPEAAGSPPWESEVATWRGPGHPAWGGHGGAGGDQRDPEVRAHLRLSGTWWFATWAVI